MKARVAFVMTTVLMTSSAVRPDAEPVENRADGLLGGRYVLRGDSHELEMWIIPTGMGVSFVARCRSAAGWSALQTSTASDGQNAGIRFVLRRPCAGYVEYRGGAWSLVGEEGGITQLKVECDSASGPVDTSIYSNVRRVEESGDLLGLEVVFAGDGRDAEAAIVWCEGEASTPVLAHMKRRGNVLTLSEGKRREANLVLRRTQQGRVLTVAGAREKPLKRGRSFFAVQGSCPK